MTQDDIIKMAREAELYEDGAFFVCTHSEIERFAQLVAAHEREKVARWQIGSGYTTGHGETIEDLLVELEWQIRESEREACCKAIEEIDDGEAPEYRACQEAIRARGNT
jgi:hypothetical protein